MQTKNEALAGHTLSTDELKQVSGGACGQAMDTSAMHNPPAYLVPTMPSLNVNAMVPPDPY